MSSSTTGCVNSSQPAMGVAVQDGTNNTKYTFNLDNNYDVMLYNVTTNEVTFYTNTNQVTVYGSNEYMIIILNPENATEQTANVSWFPNNPPSNFSGYQFVFKNGGCWLGKNSNGTQTFSYGSGGCTALYFNCSQQSTYYLGNGSTVTILLSSQLSSVSNLIKTLAWYFSVQNSSQINDLASQSEICGTLVGSPDSIVYVPGSNTSSSTSSSSTGSTTSSSTSSSSTSSNTSSSTGSTTSSTSSNSSTTLNSTNLTTTSKSDPTLSTVSSTTVSSSTTNTQSLTNQLFNSYFSSTAPPLPPAPSPISKMSKEQFTLVSIIALALIGAIISLSLCRGRRSRS